MPRVAVIIPAAGAGKRFGGDVKKPFAQLDNRPVFIRSIELFVNRPDVCQVILAVGADDFDVVKEKFAPQIMFMGIKLVKGGHERFASVQAALPALVDEAELVAVHDAVRPCVLPRWIDEVFAAAEQHGAAILAAPLTGTIKKIGSTHAIEATVPRDGLFEAQTPQVFKRQVLIDAYAALGDHQPTDDAEVVERTGQKVVVVPTDRRNLKITSPGDMALASSILKDFANQRPKAAPRSPFEEAQW